MGGSTDLSGGGRGGGVPPPETERVGWWNPVEGCAPTHWREQENRAESMEQEGGGATGPGKMGVGDGMRSRPSNSSALTSAPSEQELSGSGAKHKGV